MRYLAAFALLAASPAAAEVVSASSNGFEVRQAVNLVVPPPIAFSSFADIGAWWDPEHTYSGDSANLSLRKFAPLKLARRPLQKRRPPPPSPRFLPPKLRPPNRALPSRSRAS